MDICLSRSPERPVLPAPARSGRSCRVLGVRPRPRGPRLPVAGRLGQLDRDRAGGVAAGGGGTGERCGGRLYLSPHTVNTRLRYVFAELGVPDRVALAAVVSRSIK